MERRDEDMTFSVHQLARMFRRSEQTVRRWKDQRKLTAGFGGEEKPPFSGALVFTREAVLDFVRRNPSVLNRAEPWCRDVLYGNGSFPREVGGVSGVLALGGGSGSGEGPQEDAGPNWRFYRPPEPDPDEDEEGEDLREHAYFTQLLHHRNEEIEKRREELREELERILEESETLEEQGGSPYLRQLLRAREREVRNEELELVREHSRLVREQFSQDGPGPYLRELLLRREEQVVLEREQLEEELETIRRKKAKLGL